MCEKLDTSRQTLTKYLQKLLKEGLIEKKEKPYPYKYYLPTKEIILTNPLINPRFAHYLLKKIHEILNNFNEFLLIFDFENKYRNDRREIIEKVLEVNSGRYLYRPANPEHIEIIEEIINKFIEILNENKPDVDKDINLKKRDVYRVYDSFEQDILHELRINFNFSTNSFLNLINSESIRKQLTDVILKEVFQNPIYYKGIKKPKDLNFEIKIKYNFGENLRELIDKADKGTQEAKIKKILEYIDKSLGIENIQDEQFESIQEGYIKFLEEYDKIVKNLKDFKERIIENNEDVKDKFLPFEAFIKNDRNFSKLNRRGFFFSLKSFPIISLFNDRFYWKEWRVVDENGLLNFFTKPSEFLGKPENFIYIQWGYFIEKLKETKEKTIEEFEYFVKNIIKYNEL
jgi:predicted transcriptional regulator